MPDRIYITNRIRNLIILCLASVFLSVSAYSIIASRPWIGRPFPGFLIQENNMVFQFFLPEWEGFKAGLRFHDIVVAVDGKPVTFRARRVKSKSQDYTESQVSITLQ